MIDETCIILEVVKLYFIVYQKYFGVQSGKLQFGVADLNINARILLSIFYYYYYNSDYHHCRRGCHKKFNHSYGTL